MTKPTTIGQQGSANVYERFIEELDALTIMADFAGAAAVVGELTRAVKRAQMVVDGELRPVTERSDTT